MTWTEVLESAGYPTRVLVLDFESYFDQDYGFEKLSTVEYVMDDRWETLGFGFQVMNDPEWYDEPMMVDHTEVESMMHYFQECFGKDLEGVTFVAKNCKFDAMVMLRKYGICPRYVVDIDDLLRHYDARMKHGMAHAAPMFGLQAKGDTKLFKGKHWSDIAGDPELYTKFKEYTLNDVDIECKLLKILLPEISNAAIELKAAQHTLMLFLKPEITFDFDLAEHLKSEMTKTVEKAILDSSHYILSRVGFTEEEIDDLWATGMWYEITCEELSKDLRFIPHLQAALPPSECIPVKAGKPGKTMITLLGKGNIPQFAKDDDGCKWLLAHPDPQVSMLMSARQAVKSWPLHIKRVNNFINQSRATYGKFCNPIKYYGAHTGRWSGEEGVNTLNLGGKGRGKAINKLISQVRHLLTAGPGHTFVIVDSSQIEARNLAWFAGQGDLLDDFATGGDPYSSLASDLFQCKVWKWNDEVDVEEYPGQKVKVGVYRGFGKDAILGCGYGMGKNKFYTNCIQNDVLRPLFDSGEYDEEFVGKLVRTYRKKYHMIPKFWGTVERAWRVAAKYGERTETNNLVFFKKGESVFVELPSGRRLRYRHAKVNRKEELRWHHGVLWGGSLTENIVQAACRDLLWYWIDRVEEETGHRIIHHVYDEAIGKCREREAEQLKSAMVQIMCETPDWAEGMPLGTEEFISPCYTK